ncbi:MAG: macro domain-containing protein [Promethearchaeota archaeon]
MNQIQINNTIIEIFVGDYINTEYDVMVIPTNSRLLPSGELRCEVLRNAGAKVQVECNQIINKICTIPIGSAVMTSGGNLRTTHLIHVHGPKLGIGHEGKKLAMSTWNCLRLADDAGLKSILFPPISNEMFGFNAKICADVMLPTMRKYILEKNQNLKNISICLKNLPDYKDFEKVIDNL